MSSIFQIINPRIGVDGDQSHWLELGQPLMVNGERVYRLMCDRQGDRHIAVFAEEVGGQFVRNHVIEDGHWICDHIRTGFLEIIPKALRYDSAGRVDAVLVELLHTPVKEMFKQ